MPETMLVKQPSLTDRVLRFDSNDIRDLSAPARFEKARELLALVAERLNTMDQDLVLPPEVQYGLRIAVELSDLNPVILKKAEAVAREYNKRAGRNHHLGSILLYEARRVPIHKVIINGDVQVLYGYEYCYKGRHRIQDEGALLP